MTRSTFVAAGLALAAVLPAIPAQATQAASLTRTFVSSAGNDSNPWASLKDPDAAKYKWMPVVLAERQGVTDYCGLVNGKNSYGGYTGFVRFYAQLQKDDKGQFTRATMRAVEEANREVNPLDPRWMNGVCEQFGYSDFDLAN